MAFHWNKGEKTMKKKTVYMVGFMTMIIWGGLMGYTAIAFAAEASVDASSSSSLGVKTDGTVICAGTYHFGGCDVSSWSDIQQVATGWGYTVGLKTDGTLVAVGYNDEGQSDVSSWSNIKQVSATNYHTAGLKTDGTVVAVGFNSKGQCDVSSWINIDQVAAGWQHTVGLKKDGTVVAVGNNDDGQCDVSSWDDIIQVAAGGSHTLGLKTDGTVVAVGNNDGGLCDVSSWNLKTSTKPDAPSFTVTTQDLSVTLSWNSVSGADGYTLFYAPYPDADTIYSADMGTETTISFSLWNGAAFYVAVQAYNSDGNSGFSNIEYFIVGSSGNCGAYVAPGAWKEFDCYNLAAIGKTTNDDPFTPSWRLIGGYWQWGRKGPDSNQWYDTNTEHFAHGPTGPDSSEANQESISSWDDSYVLGAWSDSQKTAYDPCPAGFRVPSKSQWEGVNSNNTQSTVGTWDSDYTNYSSARFFGSDLMLPAAGRRTHTSGTLFYRGLNGRYWSSSETSGNDAWYLLIDSGSADMISNYRRSGFSVRCVAE